MSAEAKRRAEERERVNLPLTGMTCAACARRIERGLANAEGVRAASVNFATARATVEYDRGRTGVRRLMQAVSEMGYGTSGIVTVEFVVEDSARVSGTARVLENSLKREPGVVEATFNPTATRVRVAFLETTTDVPTLRKRIEELGYRVSDVLGRPAAAADREERARASERRSLKRRFTLAAGF